MTNKIKILFLLLVIATQLSFAQKDTLVSYDIESKQTHVYGSISINTSKVFDNTGWNYGTDSGRDLLPLTEPNITYNNSGFTNLFPLYKSYSVNNYPARTAVKIFSIINGKLKQKCSGILVAKNYVLTSCHCTGNWDSIGVFQFLDSIVIAPAFDNGNENIFYGISVGTKYFTFKTKQIIGKDIALIKLKEDIGLKTGWVGIAFSTDDNYYKNRVFHKFSYPGTVDPYDSTRIFNGDTLYYNYGTLGLVDQEWLGYDINGIPGQSGSSLFYTNNVEYYSLGTQSFSDFSRHFRITPGIFYAFQSIIDGIISHLEDEKEIGINYYLSEAYPNPFNPSTKISYAIPKSSLVQLKVYDVLGREIQTLVNEIQFKGKYEVIFNGNDLPSGIYFCRIQCSEYRSTKKLLLMK